MFFKKKIKSTDERKERSDKKIHVGPTICVKLKREIERIGMITDTPVKDIGEALCYEGIHTPEVIARLSTHFRRSVRAGTATFIGDMERPSLQERKDTGATDRISIRFTQVNYEDIRLLATSLDVTPSRATAILLDAAIRYPEIIETILREKNKRNSLDELYTAEIRKLMRFVNRDNPYRNNSWNKTLMHIVDGVKSKVIPVIAPSPEVMAKMVDTETYRWKLEDESMPTRVPFKAGEGWKVPVGVTTERNAFRFHDFEKIPHMVLGGATRYGKSNFINSMIASLLQSEPEHVKLFLIDLKGGVELSDYEYIKQTVSIAYEPDDALISLQLAYDKMRDMQARMRSSGKKNVQEAGIKERYFIIIDEVGELNPAEAVTREEKALKQECQTLMSQIARLGAGLGFRQILATQYPTGDVIPRQCKQNSDAKLAFRVQSATASRVVLDGVGAEDLPEIVGRAIYQTADKREILQTPLITPEIIRDTIARYRR